MIVRMFAPEYDSLLNELGQFAAYRRAGTEIQQKELFQRQRFPCSTAYPISITISKSTTDLRKGSCCLSNSLIFFNPVNNFMVHIVLLKAFRCYCVAHSRS